MTFIKYLRLVCGALYLPAASFCSLLLLHLPASAQSSAPLYFQHGTATANYSFAAGTSMAWGEYSFSMGFDSQAHNFGSVALGVQSEALGWNATALSNGLASGSNSLAVGASSRATGNYGMALGISSHASGHASVAIGSGNVASGVGAAAIGVNTVADGWGQMAVGHYNVAQGALMQAFDPQMHVFIVGNGTGDSTRSNAFVVKNNGDVEVSGVIRTNGPAGDIPMIGQ